MRQIALLMAILTAAPGVAHAYSIVRMCEPMAKSAEVMARRISLGLDATGGLPEMERLAREGAIDPIYLKQYRQMIADLTSHPGITPATAYQLSIAVCGWRALSTYR